MNQDVKTKIAFWYHTCHMTQDEIARRLGLTRQKVNTVIGSLRDEGIVTVSVRGCEREHLDWEHLLEERFGLSQAIITPSYDSAEFAYRGARRWQPRWRRCASRASPPAA